MYLKEDKNMKIKATYRNYGIDLLRIVCMFMVCTIHIESVISESTQPVVEEWLNCLLRLFCICAVNCYAIVSGYVGLNSKHKYSSIISLWITVVFYSILFELLSVILSNESVEIGDLIKSVLPVLGIRYWYFSSYFVLFFFMPLLNEFVQKANRVQKACVLLGIVSISVGSTFFNALNDLWSANSGYSALWLFCMYYLGALLKKHPINKRVPWLAIYGISIIISFGFKVSVQYCGGLRAVFGDGENLLSYTSPMTIVAAVSLFMFFSKLKVKDRITRYVGYISPLAFSVYLIHYNKQVWAYLKEAIIKLDSLNYVSSTFLIILVVIIVFTVCVLIDTLRLRMFMLINIQTITKKIEKAFERFIDYCILKVKKLV